MNKTLYNGWTNDRSFKAKICSMDGVGVAEACKVQQENTSVGEKLTYTLNLTKIALFYSTI